MNQFKYFSNQRIYNDIYFQYPKVFIYGDKYKNLSDGAKLAYMLLKNELTSAIHHNLVDENGYIYFEMTSSYLAILMNCSERKVARVKSELEEANLLMQVKMGFDKNSGKNKPNRLYLAELEVTDRDVYLMNKNAETLDNSGHAKMAGRSKSVENAQKPDTTTIQENKKTSKTAETLDNSGRAKMAENVYKYNNQDTNRHLKDTDKDELQNQIFLDNFVASCHTSQVPTFIPDKVLQLIATFSPSYEVASQTVKTIHNAKYKAQEQTGIMIVFEELEQQGINAEAGLYQTLLKAYQKNKTEKVKDIQNLIFVYVRNWFIEKPIALIQQDQNQESLPDVSMDSWL
ncbi:replication initiator protein A [Enterococcus sp. AZ103]|uniref:replication initiator protein A n=1 Tax=Enterococcus sp. AZ103 TaxID=2774628 RepID=UPI003F21E8BB